MRQPGQQPTRGRTATTTPAAGTPATGTAATGTATTGTATTGTATTGTATTGTATTGTATTGTATPGTVTTRTVTTASSVVTRSPLLTRATRLRCVVPMRPRDGSIVPRGSAMHGAEGPSPGPLACSGPWASSAHGVGRMREGERDPGCLPPVGGGGHDDLRQQDRDRGRRRCS